MITVRDIRKRRPIHVPPAKTDVIRSTNVPRRPAHDAPKRQHLPAKMLADLLPVDAFADAPRVWIIGGGPSFKSFDKRLLKGEIVIAANYSYMVPASGMCVSLDDRCIGWFDRGELGDEEKEVWKDWDGVKVFSGLLGNEYPKLLDDVYHIPRTRGTCVFPPDLRAMPQSNNSGHMALLVAWALGAKEIRLLGIDLSGRKNGRQQWWHKPHPEVATHNPYPGMLFWFDNSAPVLRRSGVNVINYSPLSKLSCFPKQPHTAAYAELKDKPTRPIVIGCYTKNTPYEQEIKEMARSARAFGLDVYTEPYESTGEWAHNAQYKAQFIKDCLDRFKAPVLYLDADSRIRRYPALFDNLDAGFAYCPFKWPEWGNPDRPPEISSAVLYARPLKSVYRLLDKWITALRTMPHEWDQKILAQVLHQHKWGRTRVLELPPQYDMIFDSMAHLGVPVIEQMQASRRFRNKV